MCSWRVALRAQELLELSGESLVDQATLIVQSINSMLWGVYCLIPLLVGTGIYFTWKLRFVQVKRLGEALRQVFGDFSFFGKSAGKDGMSSF